MRVVVNPTGPNSNVVAIAAAAARKVCNIMIVVITTAVMTTLETHLRLLVDNEDGI